MSTDSKRLQPLNESTNLLRASTLTMTQHQLGEDTNIQLLQAPTCRKRHKVSPSTSLPPLFARLSNRIKMQQYRHVSAYQTTMLCSTSALCSFVLFNCSAHSSVPLLCSFSQVYSTQHALFSVSVLFSLSHHCTIVMPLSLINVYIHILTVLIQYQSTALIS